jgi:hypothetical protein
VRETSNTDPVERRAMELSDVRQRLEHPSFGTTAGTIVGYLVFLLAIFVVLFLLPFAILTLL